MAEDPRVAALEEHVRFENLHDLEGIMKTFGEGSRYDDEAWDEHYVGAEAVRSYYTDLIRAAPDLHIDVRRRHVTPEAIVLEVVITGTHSGMWRGLPGTGKRVEFPLCAVYTFGPEGKLASEKIYFDRATVLRQLGVFHEPTRWLGRVLTPLTHPVTMTRALGRAIARR
jgi:steroid delta-isomerase-like uncharacterized protein